MQGILKDMLKLMLTKMTQPQPQPSKKFGSYRTVAFKDSVSYKLHKVEKYLYECIEILKIPEIWAQFIPLYNGESKKEF